MSFELLHEGFTDKRNEILLVKSCLLHQTPFPDSFLIQNNGLC